MADALTPNERDVLAGEWVLGLIDPAEREDARRSGEATAGWSDAVRGWEDRLASLFGEVEEVAPDARVWSAIEAGIAADGQTPRAANDDLPDGSTDQSRPWKIATAAMTAIAASLAVVVATRAPSPSDVPAPVIVEAPRAALIAQLNDGEGNSMLAIRAEQAAMTVRATAIPAGAGEPELWVIAAGGAPVSLGQVARDGETRVALTGEAAALVADGATLALTLEPVEGSPHSAPSGNILGTARITRL